MLDQRRVATQPDENCEQSFREQLFIERYESLRALALRLSNQVDAADDLVQDAFVQWVLSRTRLEEIENIDGYLRTMLRYMHFARMNRSAQQLHETALSIADYDSCHFGWAALAPPRRMQASEDLHQICVYACARKESSKAGSVLILRFFHNYFPTEIASVLNSSRNCVDQWQRLARREAKLFMNEPRRLRFVDAKTSIERHQIKYLRPDSDLMLDLRQMIFNSCEGDCLSQHELAEIYSATQTDALSTAKFAHIVSCADCLDAVNRMLGLPPLADRYRNDAAEPKEPPSNAAGGGASGSGPGEIRKKFARRLRETHEHKPQELRIAVNGFLVSTIKISAELSELDLNLTPDDPIEFVEVSSEQNVQLLFFSINPSRRYEEQWAWIRLSEGRCLEACYQDESGPTLHVAYKDPAPAEAYVTGENSNALSSPLFVVPAVNELNEPSVGARGAIANARSWVVRLFSSLRTTAGQGVRVEETKNKSIAEETLATSLARSTNEAPFLKLLSQAEDGTRSWRRLGLLVFLVSAALVAGLLFFKANLSPTLTATALLEQASIAENHAHGSVDLVRHRFINLEERRSAEGAIVARRKIEIWSNNAKGESAQRLYDDSNRLVAAAWQNASSRTIYHHGSRPQAQPALVTPENLLFNLEDVWQLEPSPETFGKLIAETNAIEVEERSTAYVLSFEKGRAIGASNLLKATLTLSKSNLHPIEQTLLVQRGNDLREYRFVEAGFELVPLRDVAPAVFEIEPELNGGAGELGRPGDWALRDLTTSRVPPPPSTSTPPAASAELEVDVAYLLNQAKADRNEQVTLTRSAGGSLRVEGVVDTAQRKNEFLQALAPVSNNPAVKIEIHTVAEATQPHARTIIVQEAEPTANTVAADEDLRAYFKTHIPSGSTDEAIRNYSSRMVNRAYHALFHAIELKRLVNRFANVDMRTVAPDARAKWLAMLREHARALANDNAVLLQELQPVFPAMVSQVADEAVIQSDADLARGVERLHKLALANNEAISSAFAISSRSSASPIKSPAFWQSIVRAESLAKDIAQYQTMRD